MTVGVRHAVFSAGVAAVIGAVGHRRGAPVHQEFGPHAVDIDIAGVIEHVGSKPAGGTHVDLEGRVFFRCGLEELDVKKPITETEGVHACAPV